MPAGLVYAITLGLVGKTRRMTSRSIVYETHMASSLGLVFKYWSCQSVVKHFDLMTTAASQESGVKIYPLDENILLGEEIFSGFCKQFHCLTG